MRQQGREVAAEARGDFVRRARGDIADGFQPGTAQAGCDRRIGAERGHRQGIDRLGFLAVLHDSAGASARQRARANRCTCNRRADEKAMPGQRAADHSQQRGLATEQMGTAGNVQEQAMRRIERHQRRETVAPVGDIVQDFGVRDLIGIEHHQFRTDGAGIGERLPGLKTATRGLVVESINLQRVVLFGDDNAGNVIRPGAGTLDSIDGQARQPQAEDTPPVPRKSTHHISIP